MQRPHAAERPHVGEIRTDLCGFVIARHPRHGLLLLQANKAKKGGIHYQLPGGHVNRDELVSLGPEAASKVAAARELYEETGIDARRETGRLQKVDVGVGSSKRSFFVMDLRDSDGGGTADALLPDPDGHHIAFRLQLSDEHTGFVFEQSLEKAAMMVQRHSGGYCSSALLCLNTTLERHKPRHKPRQRLSRTKSAVREASRSMLERSHFNVCFSVPSLGPKSGFQSPSLRRKCVSSVGYNPPQLLMSDSGTHCRPRNESAIISPAEHEMLAVLEREREETANNFRPGTVSSDCCGLRCWFGERRPSASAQVDPKTYFANERTFLNWMHMSVTLGSFGMLMFSVAEHKMFADAPGHQITWVAFAMVVLSLGAIMFAITSFYKRSELVRQRAEGPYEMSAGPVLCGVLITAIFGVLTWIWSTQA
jgi:8-oxo-dGTP pyrophosphatase MutT (NUDIX family)/uncharacterized membrane protein YidH (DUF202 family)